MKLEHLNAQQLQAVKHYNGPALVVAGAGTGKTQVITHRIANLIQAKKVPPSQILAVTFTDKAAREMESRIADLLGRFVLDVNITTFNAYGNEVLRRFAYELGMSPNLQLISTIQQQVFLEDHLDELGLKYYSPITNPQGLLAGLVAYFSQLSNELISAHDYVKYARSLQKTAANASARMEAERHLELANALKVYQRLKRQHNMIDFDDQVSLTVSLLEDFPNVREKLRAESEYILVDEFQDTNPAQGELLKLLARADGNIMVVGDDDQSIYGFRGARVANIMRFLDDYPKAKRISLVKNYRSGQKILDTAYRLINHNNPERLESKYQIDKRLKGQFKGREPTVRSFSRYEEEASYVASRIKKRLSEGESANTIAILVRKNAQISIIARYLSGAGVDYHIIGSKEGLYAQPIVRLLHYFLRAIVDPQDSDSLYHLLTSAVYKIKPVWLRHYSVIAQKRHLTLEGALTDDTENDELRDKVLQLLQQIHGYRSEVSNISVGQLCFMFLKNSGYLRRLIRQAKDDPSIDTVIASLNQFFGTLREFESVSEDPTAIRYIKVLPTLIGGNEKLDEAEAPDLFGEKVRVMTVHKAKGLEFDTVFLFDLTQESFPARSQRSSLEVPLSLKKNKKLEVAEGHISEERRLMYVAMTRARKELVITFSIDHGGRRPRRPSIFIEEMSGKTGTTASLSKAAVNTDQIDLFSEVKTTTRTKPSLPEHLLQGDQLRLTQRQIDDYLMCPAEFYLRHILSPPLMPTFALTYGNLIHNLIQQYNRGRLDGQAFSYKQLEASLEAGWPREGFVSKGHRSRSLAQARATLRKFWLREERSERHPTQIEQSFEVELPNSGVLLRGRFDAVYETADVEIRDYKTGAVGVDSALKAETKAKASFQLGVYALAWQIIRGQAPSVLTLDFVDSGYLGSAEKTPSQLKAIEAKIDRAAKGIRAGDFRPAKSHLFCTHPEYGF